MSTSMMLVAALVVSGVVASGSVGAEKQPPETPEHQVVALYFHRTERCPTCKRIGAMAEEAVTKGFEEQVEARAVEFHFVDFQDQKNGELVKAYRIDSPTLVLANVYDSETIGWVPMPKVWQLVGKPDDFSAYVQEGVVRYLTQSREDAEREREKSRETPK